MEIRTVSGDHRGPMPLKLSAVWKNAPHSSQPSNMLIGKLVAEKAVNKRSVITTIRKGWNLGDDTDIVEMPEGAYVFTFKDLTEKYRILQGRPWAVQGVLMCIKEWNEFMVLEDVSFKETPVWVQFHNMPLGLMEEEENIQNMGSLVGRLVWYERPKVKDRLHRSFARVRVLIEVDKPLVTEFWMDRPGSSEVKIGVKYERVSFFCYKCGMIGHDFKSCKAEVVKFQNGQRVFGQWVTALPEKDFVPALTKFDQDWPEEDCRRRHSEAEEFEEEERGNPQAREERVGDTSSAVCQGDVSGMRGVGDARRTLGAMQQAKVACRPGDVAVLTGEADQSKTVMDHSFGPDKPQEAHDLLARPNPPLAALPVFGHVDKSPNSIKAKGDKEPKYGRSGRVREPGPIPQLSPISAMSNRMGEVTLKRTASEPDSPKPAKKRCLFVEEEQVEPIEESVSGLVGRKSVKEVKKSMRGKARKKHRELLPVSLAAEIDFPQEWVVAGSQEAKGMAETQDAERLSGCPPTATKEL